EQVSAIRAVDAGAPGCSSRLIPPALIEDAARIRRLRGPGTRGVVSRSPALRNGIGFGRVDWGDDGVDANAARTLAEIAPIDRVAIAQQMPRLLAPGRRFDHLPPDPGGRRVGRHVDMHQFAPAMSDEQVSRMEGDLPCHERLPWCTQV